MKNRMSRGPPWPPLSRKDSAIVSPERAGAARSGRLVHLAEDHGHLRIGKRLAVDLGEVPVSLLHGFGEFVAVFYHSGLYHLAQQVVALTGALAYSREH